MGRDRRSRTLIITPEVRADIAAAIERARAHPVTLETALALAVHTPGPELTLADRKPGAPPRPPSECLLLPGGFQVAFSFEEQPAGLVRHMSVAVDNPGKIPDPNAVALIAREYGFAGGMTPEPGAGRVWVEEFRPGCWAVNVAELVRGQ